MIDVSRLAELLEVVLECKRCPLRNRCERDVWVCEDTIREYLEGENE